MSGKVLVVDSDMATRRAAMVALLPAGYEMQIAEAPFEAFGVAQREHPEVIVLGDSMTDANGLALIGRLFSSPATAAIPVVVIANSPEAMDAATRAGARSVLPGPVSPAAFLHEIAARITSPGELRRAPEAVLGDPDRLAAVEALRPGPDGEPSLDRFTALASTMLNAPVSIITLIDLETQQVASQVGRDEPGTAPTSMPLTHSFCQFAVTSREPLRVDDAAAHPLVATSLAYTEDGVQAYLGIPLVVQGEHAVGALCVTDTSPRHWTDADVELLDGLAGILTAELDGRVGRGRHSAP